MDTLAIIRQALWEECMSGTQCLNGMLGQTKNGKTSEEQSS
jgi:hypothetical protein